MALRARLEAHLEESLRTAPVGVGPSEREAFLDATMADMVGWGALAR